MLASGFETCMFEGLSPDFGVQYEREQGEGEARLELLVEVSSSCKYTSMF